MRSVVLVTDPSATLGTFRAVLERHFDVALNGEAVGALALVVREGQEYAWLDPLGDIRDEYDEGELDVVGIGRVNFFDVRYRSIAFLRRVLRAVADDPRVWVDLEAFAILHGPDLVARMEREPEWLLEQPTVTGD